MLSKTIFQRQAIGRKDYLKLKIECQRLIMMIGITIISCKQKRPVKVMKNL